MEIQTYRMAQNASFSAESPSIEYSDTITKAGFYPLGIVGYRSSKALIIPSSARLQNPASGTCSLHFRWDYVGVGTDTANLYADILWVRE